MNVPAKPKIYHIVHVDRLASIIGDGCLWCDAEMVRRDPGGTAIGMTHIKRRRLEELTLSSHPDLHVGDCVPFYFCPRSVMLYIIHKANHIDLEFRQGQDPIVHLEADLHTTVAWADRNRHRWAFTLSNAGSRYFEDHADLSRLGEIDWNAVQAHDWKDRQDKKQAEFLIEHSFPWDLVERIGVRTKETRERVMAILDGSSHRPLVEIRRDWYY